MACSEKQIQNSEEQITRLKEEVVSLKSSFDKSTLVNDVLEQEKNDLDNALHQSDMRRGMWILMHLSKCSGATFGNSSFCMKVNWRAK